MTEAILYIVPTPIGNLDDITLRAIKVLQHVDLILAEDTRNTHFLCKHFEIQTNIQSYHKDNEHKQLERIINLLKEGKSIALVSDAGTPAISDPGFLLVREAITHQIKVECLPGATACIPAIVVSGFPCDRFIFEGFLPHQKGRQKRLLQLQGETRTIILYESPYRINKLLQELATYLGEERLITIARELSKKFEEIFRGSISDALLHYSQKEPKGEFVVVIKGKNE